MGYLSTHQAQYKDWKTEHKMFYTYICNYFLIWKNFEKIYNFVIINM